MQNLCFVLLLAAESPTRSCSDPPDRERGDTKYYFDVGFCVLFPFYDDIRYICCSPVTQTSPKTFDESVSLCSSWGMGLAKFFSLQERDLITSIYCKGNCASLSLILKTIFVGVDGLEGSGNKLRTALHNPDGLSCEGPTFCSSVLKWHGTQVKDPPTFFC